MADRISELPEPILHRILCSLSQKEAIQTSALSKTWRHVGPTRPKIELRRRFFFSKSYRASFLSVLGKTLQRYYHRNLSVYEFILEMASSDHLIIDSEFANDPGKNLFKGLKKLSLINLHIKDNTTLENIIRSCPLIEYLLVSDCEGLTAIPLTIFQAEFLTELHLIGCYFFDGPYLRRPNLIVTSQLLLIKRLKTLSLEKLCIAEETLDEIMCGCPLIERLFLTDCEGLTNIKLIKNNNNLKHFTGSFDRRVNTQSFEIDAPTIETIRIKNCPNWYGHDKYLFPHLKGLYLNKVKMSAELFDSFSSNFPSLEELELEFCYGLEEIQLSACSIKRLILIPDSKKPIKATIYAPNIHYFQFSGDYPPKLILYSETERELKSHVDIWCGNKDLNLTWLLQLNELLNSLRKSQIYLRVSYNPFKPLKVEGTNDAVFCKPVPLECLSVSGGYESSFPNFLDCLFLICRPRYICMRLYIKNPVTDLKKKKDKLAEFITFKTIRNEGEMSRSCLWERDLEEISIQFWDDKSQGWHTVGIKRKCFPRFKPSYTKVRFSMKWRD